ncbi:hypothetical protein FZW96_07330 [Bacillus sp. BGMRC 2118]|nr:hypothetical protein FZW96_07330 [Bacillus sp. BGMRC 2118]
MLLLAIIFSLLNVAITFYVLYSLSVIKHQQRLMMKHFSIKEEKPERVSNDEIEKELENYVSK